MTLLQKQQIFSTLVAKLILKANEMGYSVTLAEAFRPEFTAKKYQEMGIGIENSLHSIRLAIDLNLFKPANVWLRYSEDYRPLGEWWESQSTPEYELCWGGHWKDGNHFSLKFGTRK